MANRPNWTDADRKAVQAELSSLVARHKLEVEYSQTGNTDGPMWSIQKTHSDFAKKVASAIQDDPVIRKCADLMDQRKLMEFITHHGERQLDMHHTKEWMVERVSASPAWVREAQPKQIKSDPKLMRK